MAKTRKRTQATDRATRNKQAASAQPRRRIDPPPGTYGSEEEANLYDDYARKRIHLPQVKRAAELVGRLLAKTGYGNLQARADLDAAWQKAAGAMLSKHTRPGSVQRGTWEIFVRNSALLQELSFQQSTILRTVQQALPDHKIKKFRFKVGPIE